MLAVAVFLSTILPLLSSFLFVPLSTPPSSIYHERTRDVGGTNALRYCPRPVSSCMVARRLIYSFWKMHCRCRKFVPLVPFSHSLQSIKQATFPPSYWSDPSWGREGELVATPLFFLFLLALIVLRVLRLTALCFCLGSHVFLVLTLARYLPSRWLTGFCIVLFATILLGITVGSLFDLMEKYMDGSKILIFTATKRMADELTNILRKVSI